LVPHNASSLKRAAYLESISRRAEMRDKKAGRSPLFN